MRSGTRRADRGTPCTPPASSATLRSAATPPFRPFRSAAGWRSTRRGGGCGSSVPPAIAARSRAWTRAGRRSRSASAGSAPPGSGFRPTTSGSPGCRRDWGSCASVPRSSRSSPRGGTPAAPRDPLLLLARRGRALGERAADLALRRIFRVELGYDLTTWLRLHGRGDRPIAVTPGEDGRLAVIRARHLDLAELIRPDPRAPWRLLVFHDGGSTTVSGDPGLAVAGKLLAVLNGSGANDAEIRYAVAKVEDAANPESYFAKVAAIAMRCWWGRFPEAPREPAAEDTAASDAERLALSITKRSFWGRGGIGSEQIGRAHVCTPVTS